MGSWGSHLAVGFSSNHISMKSLLLKISSVQLSTTLFSRELANFIQTLLSCELELTAVRSVCFWAGETLVHSMIHLFPRRSSLNAAGMDRGGKPDKWVILQSLETTEILQVNENGQSKHTRCSPGASQHTRHKQPMTHRSLVIFNPWWRVHLSRIDPEGLMNTASSVWWSVSSCFEMKL